MGRMGWKQEWVEGEAGCFIDPTRPQPNPQGTVKQEWPSALSQFGGLGDGVS